MLLQDIQIALIVHIYGKETTYLKLYYRKYLVEGLIITTFKK